MRRTMICTLVLLCLVAGRQALADDAFIAIAIDKLPLTDGKLPEAKEGEPHYTEASEAMRPYAVIDGDGEAYPFAAPGDNQRWTPAGDLANTLAIRAAQTGDVSGRLFLPNGDGNGMVALKFKVPADQVAAASQKANARKTFYQAKRSHYDALLQAGVPGGAWFRHEAREAAAAIGEAKESPDLPNTPQRPAELDDTYGLFTGGRAVSENLQLDRVLRATTQSSTPDAKDVDVSSIDGITVAAMDWKPLIKDMSPQVDPLASLVPADQHAIFFPTFDALTTVMDEAERTGVPVLRRVESASEDALTRERYERQLGLSVTALSRVLGPQLINSIAITGSDAYLRVGSDLTLLMEPKNATALRSALLAEITAARQREPGAKSVDGDVNGVAYSGAESPDRSLRSYVAQVGDAIVLTNSLEQLKRIVAVQKGDEPSLAKQPEYTFFRDRYRRDDAGETGLLVLSDATIRRWCGPRWRIADSRRTRAAAVMSEMQATAMDLLARGGIGGAMPTSRPDFTTADMGDLTFASTGVVSSTYGSLDMMTPIAELSMDHVTPAEAEAYKRWRDAYQENWRQYFDPIAIRFSIAEKKLAADVTVMPLIVGSDYRGFVDATRGVTFAPDAGDPHDTLAHLIVAFNRDSESVKGSENFAASMVPGLKVDPFGWIGKSISLYADDDPFWQEHLAAKEPEKFMEKNFNRMPIGLRIEVSNSLKLAGFLVALHGFVDQTAPQMTVWESLKYNDQSYVKISPSAQAKGENEELANVSIYYAATGQSLLITLNEPLLKRAIDRETARNPTTRAADAALAPATQPLAPIPPWLGSSIALRAQANLFDLLMQANRESDVAQTQLLAWGNLPILNEWKRRYPTVDPVQLHERVWGVRLTDPAGGTYTWNDQWQTMESSVYGHPGEPKVGPGLASAFSGLVNGSFGISFEERGLRARAEIGRGATAKP